MEARKRLYRELKGKTYFDGLVGSSPRMLEIIERIEQVGPTQATVLIDGESGTGKELVARAVHKASDRANKPLVVVNCAALPEDLLEAELFGTEPGAFTGAVNRMGRCEMADSGTLFLDEIAELSKKLQVKFLRFLQERTFERLGGKRTISVDTRVVAATNRDLREMVQQGEFREDLYYRLWVYPIDRHRGSHGRCQRRHSRVSARAAIAFRFGAGSPPGTCRYEPIEIARQPPYRVECARARAAG